MHHRQWVEQEIPRATIQDPRSELSEIDPLPLPEGTSQQALQLLLLLLPG